MPVIREIRLISFFILSYQKLPTKTLFKNCFNHICIIMYHVIYIAIIYYVSQLPSRQQGTVFLFLSS